MKRRVLVLLMAGLMLFGSVLNVSAEGLIAKPVVPPIEWTDGYDTDAENISITFLNLVDAELTLEVGKSFPVQTEVKYNTDGSLVSNPEIVWTVQYPGIASVDEQGVVTGLKTGSTLVKAKCKGVSIHYDVIVVEEGTTSPVDPPVEDNDNPVNPPVEDEQPQKLTIKSVSLSKTQYTYNGKVQTPSVTVVDNHGKRLVEKTDYTVTYSSGRKTVGTYAVTLTFKGDYSDNAKVTKNYDIVPKGTSVKKLTAAKKKITVTWKKQTKQVNGYQLQCSLKKNFKSKVATINISGKKKTQVMLTGLKAKKKYFIRIRTYKNVKVNGKTVKMYSNWSAAKKIKTK